MLSSFSERKTRLTVAVRGGLSKKMAFTGIYIILRQSSPKQPTESNILNKFTDSEVIKYG
jgi:hypothetical protein